MQNYPDFSGMDRAQWSDSVMHDSSLWASPQQGWHPDAMRTDSAPASQEMGCPPLHVSVEGLSFHCQLTEDDVRKVFSRYGDVAHVQIPSSGCAQVTFQSFANAMAAWSDLNGKGLAGINGAFLNVDCPALTLTGQISADPTPLPDSPNPVRKYTCRLEVGIENDKDYRVGSKVIQIARKIWAELHEFQQHGGKTRLRGKGVGGPHESDEPLALCISCRDARCFEIAVQFAESQIANIHHEYIQHCQERGYPIPMLEPCKAICDHPHTTAPWHAVKYDHHYQQPARPRPYEQPYQEEDRGMRPPGAPSDMEVERFIEERNEARKGGNFTRADEIRDYLKSKGVVLMDDKGARGNKRGIQVTKWRYWNP